MKVRNRFPSIRSTCSLLTTHLCRDPGGGSLGDYKALQQQLCVELLFECRLCGDRVRERLMLKHRFGERSCFRKTGDKRLRRVVRAGQRTEAATVMPVDATLLNMIAKQPAPAFVKVEAGGLAFLRPVAVRRQRDASLSRARLACRHRNSCARTRLFRC